MSFKYRFCPLAIFSAAVLAWGYSPPAGVPLPDGDASREVARIRRHLVGAEMLIRSRDLSALTAAQRGARERRVAELRSYRQRGVFPHNHGLRDRRTPVFVDEHGTRCAMAYLIDQTGERALVSRIAKTRNLARNTRGLFGVTCGLLGAALGVPALSEDGAVRALGAVDIAVGVASFGLGIRQLNVSGGARPPAAAHGATPAIWRDGGGVTRVALVARF